MFKKSNHPCIKPFIKNLNKFFGNKKLTGAEIGVFKGDFSLMLLNELNIEKLYLIDPYKWYNGYNDDLGIIQDNENLLKTYYEAEKRLRKFDNKKFIQETSVKAVKRFPKESLDFAYIDGNHNYEYVKKDIKLWWGIIKLGGVLGGHDFNADYLGICKAVIEFANKKKLILHGKTSEWWIIK